MEGSDKFLFEGEEQELRILHVTDLHVDCFGRDTLHNLKQKFIDERIEVDIVIATGDFLTLPKEDLEANDPIKMNALEEEISTIIQLLESFAPKVYYLPGNHDPPDFFKEENICLTSYSKNLHM